MFTLSQMWCVHVHIGVRVHVVYVRLCVLPEAAAPWKHRFTDKMRHACDWGVRMAMGVGTEWAFSKRRPMRSFHCYCVHTCPRVQMGCGGLGGGPLTRFPLKAQVLWP